MNASTTSFMNVFLRDEVVGLFVCLHFPLLLNEDISFSKDLFLEKMKNVWTQSLGNFLPQMFLHTKVRIVMVGAKFKGLLVI